MADSPQQQSCKQDFDSRARWRGLWRWVANARAPGEPQTGRMHWANALTAPGARRGAHPTTSHVPFATEWLVLPIDACKGARALPSGPCTRPGHGSACDRSESPKSAGSAANCNSRRHSRPHARPQPTRVRAHQVTRDTMGSGRPGRDRRAAPGARCGARRRQKKKTPTHCTATGPAGLLARFPGDTRLNSSHTHGNCLPAVARGCARDVRGPDRGAVARGPQLQQRACRASARHAHANGTRNRMDSIREVCESSVGGAAGSAPRQAVTRNRYRSKTLQSAAGDCPARSRRQRRRKSGLLPYLRPLYAASAARCRRAGPPRTDCAVAWVAPACVPAAHRTGQGGHGRRAYRRALSTPSRSVPADAALLRGRRSLRALAGTGAEATSLQSRALAVPRVPFQAARAQERLPGSF